MRAAHLFFPKPQETEQVEEETMMTQFEKGSRWFHYATLWNELVISSLASLIPCLVLDNKPVRKYQRDISMIYVLTKCVQRSAYLVYLLHLSMSGTMQALCGEGIV